MPTKLKLTALAAAVWLTAVATAASATAEPEPHAPADFVSLGDVDPSIILDIRYATPHNFIGAHSGRSSQRATR